MIAAATVAVTVAAIVGFMLVDRSAPPAEAIAEPPPAGVADTVVAPVAPAPARFGISEMPRESLPELLEESPFGPLPRIGDDGSRPLEAYARSAPAGSADRPRIAVVVLGLGRSDIGSSEALDRLPPEVTLAAAADAEALGRWIADARRDGHEILLEVPATPAAGDSDPYALQIGAPAGENRVRLQRLMAKTGAYAGLLPHSDTDPGTLEPVLEEAAGRGLLVVTGDPDAAVAAGASHGSVDMVIDGSTRAPDIAGRLAELEALATERGFAVGVASALPVSIRAIEAWAATLNARGFALVPISATRSEPPAIAAEEPAR